jgi:hypothetical protein
VISARKEPQRKAPAGAPAHLGQGLGAMPRGANRMTILPSFSSSSQWGASWSRYPQSFWNKPASLAAMPARGCTEIPSMDHHYTKPAISSRFHRR